jgi:hypothetical protein
VRLGEVAREDAGGQAVTRVVGRRDELVGDSNGIAETTGAKISSRSTSMSPEVSVRIVGCTK